MSEQGARRLMSINSLKLVAGGVSLLALALLAVLASGFLANDNQSISSRLASTPQAAAALPSSGPALHEAIAEGNREIVKILVEAGANVDAKNRFGDPALHRAILKGDSEMVRILVEAGANVNITNAYGDSALNRAIPEGNKEIVQILADAGGS